MIKRHWTGILRWFHSKIANGIMEAVNGSPKPPKPRRAAIASPATSRRSSI